MGKGGQKAKRNSTPRGSLNGTVARDKSSSQNTSGSSSRGNSHVGNSLESLNVRLRKLQEETEQPVVPFRIKFVNNKEEATMADIYPYEEFNDIVQRITAKLRMTRHAEYVLMYKDNDDEEIGVACSDNLREMFAIFEPGSRLQLRIVPFNINNSGALDSIGKIWEYSHTPNVFVSEAGDDSDSDVSNQNVNISDIKLETSQKKQEMEQKPVELTPPDATPPTPKPASTPHMAVEDIAQAGITAAAAAAAQAATETGASSTKPEPPTSKQSASTSSKSSPKSSAVGTPGKSKDAEELRQAIMLMSTNLSLAIESLGTKLTRNFDKLSEEQASILESVKKAAERQKQEEEENRIELAKSQSTKADIQTAAAESADESPPAKSEDIKVEIDTKDEHLTVEIKSKDDAGVEDAPPKDDKPEPVKEDDKVEMEEVKTEPVKEEVKVEEAKPEPVKEEPEPEPVKEEPEPEPAKEEPKPEPVKEEVKVEEVKVQVEDPKPAAEETKPVEEVIHVEIIDEPSVSKVETKPATDNSYQSETFRFHFAAANFAFHNNPYASSFFQHGFAETGMPHHFEKPCLMSSPFKCNGCSCRYSNCAHCMSSI
ncbi:hypothetical protein COEREDRAFT_81886 [Coemansia reversa NRRL 1564]|uniref:PB1 domain-containing protein n=1 Tax=Coemansia reversa (strain ATCC 12441 / NRRL 1564) TaxID=763665 RepID=A0A2G5B996_COERN|nr:hypothetical protein COEREDRAFT_81886 [Coemansia reversa NRRL 1564]|eukprot:PIA15552.1 hypothetical protein COEREDRAFT_81886 [Coemansia reversa NRRL 1564]